MRLRRFSMGEDSVSSESGKCLTVCSRLRWRVCLLDHPGGQQRRHMVSQSSQASQLMKIPSSKTINSFWVIHLVRPQWEQAPCYNPLGDATSTPCPDTCLSSALPGAVG